MNETLRPEALHRLADEELMTLVERKDADAFAVLYDRHGAAAVAAGLIAGCGGDGEDDVSPEETDKVGITDFRFAPRAVSVPAGTEVTFTNGDVAPHTATADDDSFDTGRLELGDQGSITFDRPGAIHYYCVFHPFMRGTVEVTE